MVKAVLPFLSFRYSGSTRITPSISRQTDTDTDRQLNGSNTLGKDLLKGLYVEKPRQMPLNVLTNGSANLLSKYRLVSVK